MAIAGDGRRNDEGEDPEVLSELEEEEAWSDDVPVHPVANAAEKGDLEALRQALDDHDGSIDDPVEDGDTALHLSCLYGHFPCVQLLVERGADIEVKDEEEALPLHDACAGGFTNIVQFLFDVAGSSEVVTRMLNTIDSEGETPLHHAARGQHADVVRLLLNAGASPNSRNTIGKTPAELADHDSEARTMLEAAQSASSSAPNE